MSAAALHAPQEGLSWIALSADPLPVVVASAWVVQPSCGAVVTFTGTARDHAPGREGVELLEYAAYAEPAVPLMSAVVAAATASRPTLGPIGRQSSRESVCVDGNIRVDAV